MTPFFKDFIIGLACAAVVIACALLGTWLAVHA